MSNMHYFEPTYIHHPKEVIALPCAELIKMVETELITMQSCTYQISEVLGLIVKSHSFGKVYQAAMVALMPNTMSGLSHDDIYILQQLLHKAFTYIAPILTEALATSGLNTRPVTLSYFTHNPYAIMLEVLEAQVDASSEVTAVKFKMEWSH